MLGRGELVDARSIADALALLSRMLEPVAVGQADQPAGEGVRALDGALDPTAGGLDPTILKRTFDEFFSGVAAESDGEFGKSKTVRANGNVAPNTLSGRCLKSESNPEVKRILRHRENTGRSFPF